MSTQTIQVTREMLVRYAGASGDFNPIHYSDHFACELGQQSVIAHGMLTMGLAMRLVTDLAGDPSRVRSCQFRFKRPVPVPDDADGAPVRFELVTDDSTEGPIAATLTARLGDEVVGTGKATIAR